MKKIVLLVVMLAVVVLAGCTENQRAKGWGGKMNINLPPGEKLTLVTWKLEDLWYLTRPMKEGETAECYNFQEKSSFGMMEGTITLCETMRK